MWQNSCSYEHIIPFCVSLLFHSKSISRIQYPKASNCPRAYAEGTLAKSVYPNVLSSHVNSMDASAWRMFVPFSCLPKLRRAGILVASLIQDPDTIETKSDFDLCSLTFLGPYRNLFSFAHHHNKFINLIYMLSRDININNNKTKQKLNYWNGFKHEKFPLETDFTTRFIYKLKFELSKIILLHQK